MLAGVVHREPPTPGPERDVNQPHQGRNLNQRTHGAGQSLTSIGSNIAAGCADDSRLAEQINGDINRDANLLGETGISADDAFGAGHEAEALGAQMEQDSTQQTRFQAYQDRARLAREAVDDALTDVRGALRDVSNQSNGGQS